MSKKIKIGKKLEPKKDTTIIDKKVFDQKNQIPMINQLYLNEDFEGKKELSKCIKQKLNSYKSQDTKKNKLDSKFISYDEVIEKLVVSKLKCHYCFQQLRIMYSAVRSESQWTLDRVDNDLEHTASNTVIACLKCNIQRGCLCKKKFKFTKQLRLIKKY